MKSKSKSKLVPYVKKNIKSYIGDFDIKMLIDMDPNLSCISVNKMANGDVLVWIRGFEERVIFYLTYINDKKRPYYGLTEDSDEVVMKKGD